MSSEYSDYKIVGHRGFPQKFPENSLIGLVAAAKLGIAAVELDVQLSADHVPLVFHDERVDRVSASTGLVADFSYEQLQQIGCHEPARFADQYLTTPISSLADVCLALAPYPVDVFVEIKKESIARFGRALVLEKVLSAIAPLWKNQSGSTGNSAHNTTHRAKIISFDLEVLEMVKQQTDLDVGWVLDDMNAENHQQALALAPSFLIYDVKKLTTNSTNKPTSSPAQNHDLWPGEWAWFLYDIVDSSVASYWAKAGVEYIESWDPERLRDESAV